MDRVHHNCGMPCTLFLNPAVNITVESTVVSAENSHNAAVMLGQDMDAEFEGLSHSELQGTL